MNGLFHLEYDPDFQIIQGEDYAFTVQTKAVLKEISRKQEDLIAKELIALGWTPPPGSRWSKSKPEEDDHLAAL